MKEDYKEKFIFNVWRHAVLEKVWRQISGSLHPTKRLEVLHLYNGQERHFAGAHAMDLSKINDYRYRNHVQPIAMGVYMLWQNFTEK
jgi:TPP-dependent pyruvate/acetoin dehydrogenase alpha subunit